MPRITAIVRASAAAIVVAAALVGCTQTPTATPTASCSGAFQKVLLTDDSATTVTTFSAADVPKIFGISGTPAPTCYYKASSTPPAINGVSYKVTHSTLLYVGLSTGDAATLVAAIRKTASVAPWTLSYDNAPAPSTASPAPITVGYSAQWEYNFNGKTTDDKGELGYYLAAPVTQGTAVHAGLKAATNVLRIETELRQP